MNRSAMSFTKGIVAGVILGTAAGAAVMSIGNHHTPIKKKAARFVKNLGKFTDKPMFR